MTEVEPPGITLQSIPAYTLGSRPTSALLTIAALASIIFESTRDGSVKLLTSNQIELVKSGSASAGTLMTNFTISELPAEIVIGET